ncbi:leptin receptor overlapping transcript-like 1 [Bradysia coprophila]|uniref:leptin receptor overlapping transcript-like 1 n=1 Tax=Bradysia coprophila TaxID=38358 RepID=UPI00187DA8D2|nr:leptin receptor overlapping transcript-like 1 [Bradysia coprophila]
MKLIIYHFFMLPITAWTALVSLAFAGSIGMTLIILACALPQYQLWWPFFVVVFYIFSVCPTLLAKRSMNNSLSGSSPCLELAIFLTMGFVISSFALPIVLARAEVIMWGACYLTICGNFVVYGTIVGYFLLFDSEDNVYGGMA